MTHLVLPRFARRLAEGTLRASSALLLGSLLSGCGPGAATPVPEPPALQGDKIKIPPMITISGNTLSLEGPAGTAPARATILVTNLDATSGAIATTAAEDGSFAITVPSDPDDEHRVVALVDGVRSRPFDFKAVANGIAPSPRPACLGVSPGLLVGVRAGGNATFTFDNSCDGLVTVQAPRSRAGDPAVGFDERFATSVPSGGSRAFSLSIAGSATSALDEVVFVDVDVSGQTIRYPLGVYAAAAR